MDLLTPGFGLVFWTTLAFAVVFFILAKFAWPAILNSVKEREESIKTALESAEKAKEELKNLQSSNEALLKQAQEERFKILNEAKAHKDAIVNEAKNHAKVEADKVLASAQAEIENQKAAALAEVKNFAGKLAVQVAEQILRKELASADNQKELVESAAKELNFN